MTGPSRPSTMIEVGAIVVVVVLVGAAIYYFDRAPPGPTATALTSITIRDVTASLGPIFQPGIILGASSNASTVLFGGIGVYLKSNGMTLPVAAGLETSGRAGAQAFNLTSAINNDFWDGGLYGLVWNGSAWLIGGQASWGGLGADFGAAVTLEAGRITNLTPIIGPYFLGGGIFAVGWNGTAWLLGGNSSAGTVLIALQGTTVTDLTSDIRWYNPVGWVQTIHWNGREWLLGGNGIFGTLNGTTYHDLLPNSPFMGNGVWDADWNGTAWIAGGGAGRIVIVHDDIARAGPAMPPGFDQAVLLVVSVGGGWVVGGKGSTSTGGTAPDLVYLSGSGDPTDLHDLTSDIPAAFTGGEIQGGGPAPALGPNSIVFVGEGAYDNATGYGLGAAGVVTVGGSS